MRITTILFGGVTLLILVLRYCRMSSAPAASSDPRDRPSGDALLEEIDQTVPSASASAPAAPASEAGSGSSPSNGSFVVVEEEASVSAKAEVVLEGEQAEQVKEAVERADEAVEEKEENKQDPPEEILV